MADGKMYEVAADNFLELSSYQRLQIIFKLSEKKSKPAELVKEFDSTKQEVYRNFSRLEDGNLIIKDRDGNYELTEFGKTMCNQVPAMLFLSQNMQYFNTHSFGEMPKKFYMRVGQLSGGKYVKGLGPILEKWKDLYNNADKYICLLTSEIILDLGKPLVEKLKKGVKLQYILSESCTVPQGRTDEMKKINFKKYIENGTAERKMLKTVPVAIILNEKEAFIAFSDLDGDPDFSEIFYGDDPDFHEWCQDYFRYHWEKAGSFNENRLSEKNIKK